MYTIPRTNEDALPILKGWKTVFQPSEIAGSTVVLEDTIISFVDSKIPLFLDAIGHPNHI